MEDKMVLLKKKNKQINGEEEKDYERMLVHHRRRMGVLVFIAVVAVIGVFIGVRIFLNNRVYESFEVTKTINVGDVTNCEFYQYGDGELRYSNDGISYLVGNDTVWNQAFEMKKPIVDICDDYMAIADQEDTTVYIYNEEGQKGKIETAYPILDLEVAGQGVVAAITKNDSTNAIEIYDKDGTNIAMGQTVLSGDGVPLDISLSNDGTKLAATYVYLENSAAKTKVVFYNYSDVGKNKVGRIVGAFEHYEGSVISKVEFVTNDIVAALGDDVLTIYNIKQEPSIAKEIKIEEEIESVAYNSKYIVLVTKNDSAANNHNLKWYDLTGKEILKTTVNCQYTNVQVSQNMVIFNNLDTMIMISKDGIEKYNGKLNGEITSIIPTKLENKILIVGKDSIEEIKLK